MFFFKPYNTVNPEQMLSKGSDKHTSAQNIYSVETLRNHLKRQTDFQKNIFQATLNRTYLEIHLQLYIMGLGFISDKSVIYQLVLYEQDLN